MPLALLIICDARNSGWVARPAAVRALGYALMQRVDAALARRIHNMPGQKPFTLAVFPAAAGQAYLRATALDDAVAAALVRAADILSAGQELAFGKAEQDRVRVLSATLDAPPLAGVAAMETLANRPFAAHVRLRLVTPTSFSQGDRPALPLPMPDLMLRGWARRWNEAAGSGLAIDEAALLPLLDGVGLAAARIETRMVDLEGPSGSARMVGFLGEVTLEALKPSSLPGGARSAFSALTAFAGYCGTGARTTQGMGATIVEMGDRAGL